MKFETFRTHFGKQPYFTLQDVLRHPVARGVERVQLSHWVKAGKVLRLKKGIYALADALQDKKTSAWFWRRSCIHPRTSACIRHCHITA